MRLRHHKFEDPSLINLTCPGSLASGGKDGGGAQLLRQLSTIAFTKAFGFSYIHTPLSEVSHNQENDDEWTNKWENFFQLSNFSTSDFNENIEFSHFKDAIDLIPTLLKIDQAETDRFYSVYDCHSFINRNISFYEDIRAELRQYYEESERSKNLLYNKNILNVAIHVRRGDINKEQHPERFTSIKKLGKVIQQIEDVLGEKKFIISIFCEEKQKDLEQLVSKNVQTIYHLDIFDVLDHLIHADLLVTSKSTVSYVPAIVNKGIIIYEHFWHAPLQDWLEMEKDFRESLTIKLRKLYPGKFKA